MVARGLRFISEVLSDLRWLSFYLFFVFCLLGVGLLYLFRSAKWDGKTIVSPLCEHCQNVLSKSLLSDWYDWDDAEAVEWHRFRVIDSRPMNLLSTTCQLCVVLAATLRSEPQQARQNHPHDPLLLAEGHDYGTSPTPRHSLVSTPQLKISTREGRTFLQLHTPNALTPVFEVIFGYGDRALRPHPPRSISTDSESVMQLANSWVNQCSREHVECNRKSFFRPRRLLQICGPEKVHLHSANRHPDAHAPRVKYTALSHCWGKAGVQLRLTKSNEKRLAAPFPNSDLPRNFRDAIKITRSLGYSYIWIDSLCIIQDDDEDWKAESKVMSDIYASAECTIAATASVDPHGGCFRDRDSFLSTDCILMGSYKSFLYISPKLPEQKLSIEGLVQERADRAPLNERAWTFQERLLSRRILHYCEGVVLFECSAMYASEWEPSGQPHRRKEYVRHDGRLYSGAELTTLRTVTVPRTIREPCYEYVHPNGRIHIKTRMRTVPNPQYARDEAVEQQKKILVSQSARYGIRGALDMLQSLPKTSLSQAEQIECHDRWYEVVSAYSRRSITFRKDRLIALTGLIKLIGSNSGMVNVAGMWNFTLALDLLWRTSGPPKSRSQDYIAPSWSWASVDASVDSLLLHHRTTSRPNSASDSTIRFCITICSAVHDLEAHGNLNVKSRMDAGCLTVLGLVKEVDSRSLRSQLGFTPDIPLSSLEGEKLVHLAGFAETQESHTIWGALVLRQIHIPDTNSFVYERVGCVVERGSIPWTDKQGWEGKMINII